MSKVLIKLKINQSIRINSDTNIKVVKITNSVVTFLVETPNQNLITIVKTDPHADKNGDDQQGQEATLADKLKSKPRRSLRKKSPLVKNT